MAINKSQILLATHWIFKSRVSVRSLRVPGATLAPDGPADRHTVKTVGVQ